MASVDVKLTTKFIEVGIVSGSFVTTYGYNSYDTTQAGDCNEVANGSTDTAIPNVYGGSDNITRAHHLNSSGGGFTYLFLDNDSNSTWSKLRIGSSSGEKTYLRSAATFTDLGTEGRWSWSATTNSYGTTAGADIPLTILGTVENALTSVVQPNTSITSGDTSETWQINSGGGTSGQRYRIVLVSGTNADGDSAGAILQYGTYNGSAITLTLNNGDLPTSGNTCNYKVETSTGNSTFVETESGFWADCTGTGSTFSITRAAGTSAPVISSVTNNNASSPNVTATVNLSSTGSGGTLQYAQTTGTGVPSTGWQSSASFTQARGTTRYYWASQATNTAGTFDGPETEVVGYRAPDTGVSPGNATIAFVATSASITITGVTSGETYQLRNQAGSVSYQSGVASSTSITISQTSGLPSTGTSTYQVFSLRPTSLGGDGAYDATGDTYTITRTAADTTPNAFSFAPLTSQALNTEVETSAQITGIEVAVTASRSNGTGTFAVGTSSTPGTYSTSSKSITNGQYIWIKDTTSTSNGTQKSTEITVGGTSATWTYTTVSSGDVTISITYDKESGSFLPDPTFSPSVGGQNGLSNGQAYEITAGQDVIFSHASDPGSNSLTISSLSQFTSNSSFTITQGQSATRTWASNNLGNSTDQVIVTANDSANGNPTVTLYLKEPPVAPDTAVSPVTPANRSFNDTSAFNVTVNNVTSGETYKITENNFTTSLGSATASGTSVTIPMTIGNQQGNPYGQLAVGATKTYEIHASRPANLGGTGTFVQTNDTFTVTRNVEPVSVPTDIVFSDPGTNDNNVNITVTASGGSGGTLQVSDDNVNWDANGTAYAAIRNTQGTYYARRLGSQSASVSSTRTENYTPPFRAADSNISISGSAVNSTISPGATGNLTLTISSGGSLDEYRVVTTDTNTPLASGVSVGSRTGDGNITISSGEQPDAQGTSAGYKVQVRRPTATGGNNTFADTGDTFTITRQAISAPTDLVFGADPGTASASVSIVVTASGGANGTIQLSSTSNFSSTQANGTSFTFTRGTAKTIYARRVDGSVVSSTYNESNTESYLLPDTAIAGTNSTIAFNATSATTTVSGVARSTDTVAVRVNNGSTNLATRDGNGNVSFTSSLPSVGNFTDYEFFTRRAVSTGGDGSTFYATNDTFRVTRSVEPVSTPTDISFSSSSSASATVSIACTASGGSGGTLQVSQDNVNWDANGTSYTFTRGTAKTIYARRAGQGNTSSSYSEAHTVGYLLPDTAIAGTNSTIAFNATSATTTVSGVARSTDTVAVRVNNGSTNLATRDGNGNVSFTSSLPSVGNFTDYEFFTRRAVSTGGDGNTFYATDDTFRVTRSVEGVTTPTDISFGTSNATSPTVSITATASGGSGGTLKVSENNSTWVANGSSFTFTRGTAKTIYARREGVGANSASYSEAHTVAYLQPDATISVASTSIEITSSATSFSQTISNETGSSTANSTITQYRIKDSSATHESRTNYGSITVTDAPTTEGTPKSYSVEARVTSANGGSGSFINCSGSSFTVTKTSSSSGNDPTLETYGLAIYDNNEDLITSFTAGHTVLRKVFVTSSAVALSTSTHTDIDTGLTGVTTSNCVIALEGETSTQGTTGSVRLPATFVTGGNSNIHVRVGRVTSAQSVNVEVLQHSGATLGATSTSYGMSIKNGNAETVIDESSEVFSVREIIDINTSLSTQVLYSTSTTNFIYLELTQGRYPGSAGPPVPAVNCSQSVLIIPPILTGIKHPDGSYKTVLLTMPKPTSLSNFKLAMLVPASSSPEYYGGSASSYGLEFRNTSGTVVWRSDFKQAIANNIIDANQFTSGTNQNGNYDVTTGRDGVTAPVATTSDFELDLLSSDTSISLTGLNEMDPAKSYVSGSLTAMFVDYYKGRYLDPEQSIDTPSGGGQHLVGLRVTGNTTATLGTYRFRDGSTNTSNYGQRNPQSYHPEGNFVVFRIA